MVQKVDRQELQSRFLEAIKGSNYRYLEGLNPFHILLNGVEYWIYIKNLTSAHFTNSDVWRAQLPLREDFDPIKKSDIDFILLGYDGDNDVYATWNPIWVKQRLNSTDNVSLYSRLTLQKEARNRRQLRRMDLGNDGEVIVFPRVLTKQFFLDINNYFVNAGDYVAMGSKRRPEANESFRVFNNISNVEDFAKHLVNEGLSSITIGSYCHVIRSLIADGQISRNRKIFLQYDSLEDYRQAIPLFLAVPDIFAKNEKWHNLISAALRAYISFLSNYQEVNNEETQDTTLNNTLSNNTTNENEIPIQDILFDRFISLDTVNEFEKALFNNKDYIRSTVKRYSRAIRYLIKQGLIEKYKVVFNNNTSYKFYVQSSTVFFRIPEIRDMNEERHHDYSAAMRQYIAFLANDDANESIRPTTERPERKEYTILETSHSVEDNPIDWEAEFTDENGKLTKIANPELLEKLRPELDIEYANLATAFNIVEDFYGDRFANMEFADWGKLFKQINWSNPQAPIRTHTSNDNQGRKSKSAILKVETPAGKVLDYSNVSTTYCEVIQEIGPEEVSILEIKHAGVNIVSKELDSKYSQYQRPIGGGWYVMTNSSTQTKYQDLITICQEYGLDYKIQIVSLLPTTSVIIPQANSNGGERMKIRVKFPNGRTIQPNKVFETLIEVVKYAGPDRVRMLNISVGGDNMILKNPSPTYISACKPVGNGWLCNTYTSTPTKCSQIKLISEELGLNLEVELV